MWTFANPEYKEFFSYGVLPNSASQVYMEDNFYNIIIQ